ncbi:MAG: diacylglycerol kinase family protein [Clostridia bacterium]
MRFLRSVRYAWEGICYAIATQRNMRIHLAFVAVVPAAAWWLDISVGELLIVLLFIALVVALELVNTAIESVVDLVTLERHPLAKVAKDTAAGAVLVAAFVSVIAGLIIFGPPLYRKLSAVFLFS